ncbi:putative hydrolase subunit [Frankia canadensis]|uniref:Putative hydrolase subunit n=1 Tax=Frankia canadensis TaxID=1836972 RepID=A0A2I2KR05_9ACTN|nr:allophanate hydrolase subunit 1 [Frankia canadensis]SNQ48080.1 putative hydrolase subunit [Frankia canadensis]SOU55370.1 putative hydrolase subunit [Frankia canadensis]
MSGPQRAAARVLPCGTDALLLEVATLEHAERLYLRLRRDPPPGVVELVPAARTVLVVVDRQRTSLARLRQRVRPLIAAAGRGEPGGAEGAAIASAGPEVTVPVRYDGPDLAEVSRLAGLTAADVVRRHVQGRHRVAFCGFAPGFAYVAGLDPALALPRRATPRTRVPAGAVAVADTFTGVYPRSSPGGWHLIGRTDLVVFDLERDPPALLSPGTSVRFVEADPAAGEHP